jgi:hypothetical protein
LTIDDRCNEAGLQHSTAHGLKKAAAAICAEMGATDRQMMALFDWSSEKQATTDTKKANRTSMAAAAGALLASFSWARLAEASRQEQGVLGRS